MFRAILMTTAAAALAASLATAGSTQALADQAEDEPIEDRIRVVAPRITRTSRGAGQFEVVTAERSETVYYGDLDLTRTRDLYELEERIHEAATEACTLLTEMYPRGSPSTAVCIRRAVNDAMELVQEAARAAIAD